MPSATISVAEAVELGKFLLAAYDLFNTKDLPISFHLPAIVSIPRFRRTT